MQYSACMLLQTLGHRLRERRMALGFTQAELARRAGVSLRFLVQLESGRGNISVQRLADVCQALNFPLEALFHRLGPAVREKLALVGLRGAGKSTIGRALARRLDVPFVELDQLVEEHAGMTLAEIFELRGEQRYRQIERQVLDRVLDRPEPLVMATGGSIVTAPDTWRLLRERARTVWLRAPAAAHLNRVRLQGDLRPMRGRSDPLRELEAILRERAPLYGQADRTLDTEELGIEGVVRALADW